MQTLLRKALSIWLLGIGCIPFAHADEITVAVAANFTKAAKELAKHFEQATNHKVRLAFGSTGAQYAQIIHGAPFDVFFAADTKTPAQLEKDNKIIAGSRFTYAQGRLVLWSPKHGSVDAEGKVLAQNQFKHLAIANPKLAPYGMAAQQTLQALGLQETLQPKIVRGENIGQAYQFVHSGAAELGFVALAQIIDSEQPSVVAGSYWLVPQTFYEPIEQQAVLLTDKKAAREFLDFVRSAAGQKIIAAYGYGVNNPKQE